MRILGLSAFYHDSAAALVEGGREAVGWFQGRMEFGPRALGNCFLRKEEQAPTLKREYADSFEPD